jgi:hypothetical protein
MLRKPLPVVQAKRFKPPPLAEVSDIICTFGTYGNG